MGKVFWMLRLENINLNISYNSTNAVFSVYTVLLSPGVSHEAGVLYIELHLGQRNCGIQQLGELPLIRKQFIIRHEIHRKAPYSTAAIRCLNRKINNSTFIR